MSRAALLNRVLASQGVRAGQRLAAGGDLRPALVLYIEDTDGLLWYDGSQPETQAVVSAPNARFTVLTPRLIRLEFSTAGQFEDRASQAVWTRYQSVPPFEVRRLPDRLEIELTESLLIAALGGSTGLGLAWLFAARGIWLPIVLSLLAVGIMYVVQVGSAFLRERRQRRQIEKAFRYYVSPEIVSEMTAHPWRRAAATVPAEPGAGTNRTGASRNGGWCVTRTLAPLATARLTASVVASSVTRTPATSVAGSPTISPTRSHGSAIADGNRSSSAPASAPTDGVPGPG